MPLDRQLRTLVKDRVDRSRVARRSEAARALMFATVIAVLAAVGWWALAGGATRGALYSPGAVSKPHARFEQDCKVCHAGDGSGGFRAQVNDAACLSCHDGAMHHPNQKVATAGADVSRSGLTLAVRDGAPGGAGGRSADCASCHGEHRGSAMLSARSDSHCTVCHENLALAAATGSGAATPSVTAFDQARHPPFGKRLLARDEAAGSHRQVDPTVLKFNHRKHLMEVPALTGDQSCVTCHEFAPAPAGPTSDPARLAPPFAAVTAASHQRAATPDQRYAQPIQYERHCAGCHQLEVPGTLGTMNDEDVAPVVSDLVAPHRPVSEVRAFLAARFMRELDRPEGEFAIEDEDHPGTKRQLWMHANLKAFMENVGAAVDEDAEPAAATASSLVDFLTANVVQSSKSKCVLCHEVTGALPAAAGESLTLDTVPTGIPRAPRRWYASSRFDHRAHRDMSCVECHSSFSAANLGQLKTDAERRPVEETSFFNSPNLTWQAYQRQGDRVSAVTRSCVDCHHADTGSARGASTSCVTCHDFHDRSLERHPRLPAPTAAGPTTQP